MPIDPRIPMSYQAPEFDKPLDLAQKGQSMQNLARQGKIQEQQLKQNEMQMGAEQEKLMRNEQLNLASGVLNSGGQGYEQFYQTAQAKGWANADKMPPQFDPSWMKNTVSGLMDWKDQNEQQWKEKNFEQNERMMQEQRSERRYLHGVNRQDKIDLRNEKNEEKENTLNTPYGLANTPDDAKTLKTAHESKRSFDEKLKEMIALRKKHGGGIDSISNKTDVDRGAALSKDLLLSYKEMAKLGVLSQADEAILNAIIPSDPLKFRTPQEVAQGQDSTLSLMEKFKGDSDNDFNTRVSTRTRAGVKTAEQAGSWSGSAGKMAGKNSGMVAIQDPKGEVRMIPSGSVDAALKAGGKLVESTAGR